MKKKEKTIRYKTSMMGKEEVFLHTMFNGRVAVYKVSWMDTIEKNFYKVFDTIEEAVKDLKLSTPKIWSEAEKSKYA